MMRSPKRFPVPLVHISMKRTLPTIICKLFAHDNKQKSSLLWLQTFKRPDEDNVAIRGKQNLIRTFFSVL